MFKNHLKIALRNLLKQRGYTFINVAGLAIGLASCWLILLFVHDELAYDRFHVKADRMYRINFHGRMAENELTTATSPMPMAAVLMAEYPEVTVATRIRPAPGTVLISRDEQKFNESRVYFADSTFFEVFTFPLISGNVETALREPFSVVIAEDMARKYFGEENPVGKSLQFDNRQSYKVTGVVRNAPRQAHFHFDFLVSFNSWRMSKSTSWMSNYVYTYFVLQENGSAERLAQKLPAMVEKYAGPQMKDGLGTAYDQFLATGGIYEYSLQPLSEIHLHSHLNGELEPNSDRSSIIIFSLIAVFVLMLACINFMNLATARAAGRAKEIGLRKVVGSSRWQLVGQFLLESCIVSAGALLLTIVLVELLLPFFNNLSGKHLATVFVGGWAIAPVLIGTAVFVGMLAGSYPAFYLAAFRPIAVLRGGQHLVGNHRASLRKKLVISQFAISIVLMIGTFVVNSQLQYVRSRQLGFDKEHVLLIQRAGALGRRLAVFENELKKQPGILYVAATLHLPGREVAQSVYHKEGGGSEAGFLMANLNIGFDFIETLGMEIVAGRSFSRAYASDSSAFIINEAAARKLGWDDPLGKTLINPGILQGPVIGVVKDFHFASLHEEIRPAVLNLHQGRPTFIAVRVAPARIEATIELLRDEWRRYIPDQPFEYSFLDAEFDQLYDTDRRTGKISATFSALSVSIACLGLFGLAAFSSEQRTKEIGIRKVLGATVPNVIALLSSDFLKLVLLANVIAWPVAYFVMNKWLQKFAYRIEIGWWLFALAGGTALVIALLTVSTQAIKAVLANPIDSLRYE